ncbi:Tetratricopeptide-like helical domain superfamily [Sesbania bispinosa]|nr:Tetratricopeptide-like helical domain superfamily [Sesbania bispinosa]
MKKCSSITQQQSVLSAPSFLFFIPNARFNLTSSLGSNERAIATKDFLCEAMCSQKTLLRIVNKGVSFHSKQHQQQQLELAHKITLNLINSTSPNYFQPSMELQSLISCITPHVTHHVLSDPTLPPHSCLAFFHFLRTQHSHIAHKPDLKAHLILLSRLFKARKFASMKSILNGLVTNVEIHCPVSGIVSLVDECEPHFVEKLCDMLFRVCADNRLFQEAFRVFDYVEEKGLVIEERSCFVLLLALKKCGEVDLCLRFFHRMVESGSIEIRVQSLTLVIDGLCKKGEIQKAKELMDEVAGKCNIKPTVFTYTTLLNAYVGRKDRNGIDAIVRLMEKEQVVPSLATYSILIQWYASCGDIGEAEKIFEDMQERNIEMDVYVYTLIISWNCRLGNIKRASALFDEMTQRDIVPNAHTYGALIGGVCKAGKMEAAEILLKEMQSKGIDLNIVIFNTMMDGYCKRGMIDEALGLQVIMETKGFKSDVFTYNILASGLCKLHRYEEAKRTLNTMVEKGVAPNVVTFTTFIEIYCKEGNLAEAERLFRDMEKKGEEPNIVTYNTLIDAYSKKEKMKQARMLKSEMVEKGLLPDVYTYTSLIFGECIVGRVDEAVKLFNEMLLKGIAGNVATYTAIISGLSKEGRADEAFKLYDEMMRLGLTPDDRVFAALVGSLHKSSSHAAL